MQVTGKETEYFLGYFFVDPKTKKCEVSPGIKDLSDNKSAFKRNGEFKADEKTMKTFLTTRVELIFNSEFKEALGFLREKILLELI